MIWDALVYYDENGLSIGFIVDGFVTSYYRTGRLALGS